MKDRKVKILVAFLFLFLLLGLSVYIKSLINTVPSSFQVVNGEEYYRFLTDRIASGHLLYTAVTSTNYAAVPYTPLFFLLGGLLFKIFGSSLICLKVLSASCGVLSCILLGLIVYHITKSKLSGLLGALLFSSTEVSRFLSSIVRVDTLAMVFALFGVLVFLRYKDSRRAFLWAAPIFALAIFTKQTFFATPIAVCLYYFLKKDWKKSLYLGSLFDLLVLLGFLIMGLSDRQSIVQTIVYASYQTSINLTLLKDSVISFSVMHFPLILLGVSWCLYRLWKKQLDFTLVWLVVAVSVFLVTVGKPGASWHYGYETVAVLCILCGCAFSKVFTLLKSGKLGLSPIVSCSLVCSLLVASPVGIPFGSNLHPIGFAPNTGAIYKEVEDVIRGSGTVFTEEPIFPYLAGVSWEPWEPGMVLICDLKAHEWNQSILVDRFSSGYYDFVITTFNISECRDLGDKPYQSWNGTIFSQRLTNEMADAILAHYTLEMVTPPLIYDQNGMYVYRSQK